MEENRKTLSVYIHIPFCVKKCLYCDFLSAPAGIELQKRYVRALQREIKAEKARYADYLVETVFIGGGTPSLLQAEEIGAILSTLRENYVCSTDCEISMEVNPGTVTEQKAKIWKQAGINRLSIGLQSAVDAELQALGRIHNSWDFFETYRILVKTGFNNINIDLMSAIPGQTLASYRQTLKQVTDLRPQPVHISAYSLIIEEGTPFYEEEPDLPDEDTEREMYKITNDTLSQLGYEQYEISNYAKPGYACRHNRVYWMRGNYVGFGLGSASMIENVRFHNTRDFDRYVDFFEDSALPEQEGSSGEKKAAYSGQNEEDGKGKYLAFEIKADMTAWEACPIREEVQKLTIEEQMEEFMFLGLRMIQGVSTRKFAQNFGKTIDGVYPGIVDKYTAMGLLCRQAVNNGEDGDKDERIALTREGINVSNHIMAEFLLS